MMAFLSKISFPGDDVIFSFSVVIIPGDDNRGLGDDIEVCLVEQLTLIAPFAVGLRKAFYTTPCNPCHHHCLVSLDQTLDQTSDFEVQGNI